MFPLYNRYTFNLKLASIIHTRWIKFCKHIICWIIRCLHVVYTSWWQYSEMGQQLGEEEALCCVAILIPSNCHSNSKLHYYYTLLYNLTIIYHWWNYGERNALTPVLRRRRHHPTSPKTAIQKIERIKFQFSSLHSIILCNEWDALVIASLLLESQNITQSHFRCRIMFSSQNMKKKLRRTIADILIAPIPDDVTYIDFPMLLVQKNAKVCIYWYT